MSELIELGRGQDQILRRDGLMAEDEFFQAEQNARVVKDAEQYYRSMSQGHILSWNVRDQHMADTLETRRAGFPSTEAGRSGQNGGLGAQFTCRRRPGNRHGPRRGGDDRSTDKRATPWRI